MDILNEGEEDERVKNMKLALSKYQKTYERKEIDLNADSKQEILDKWQATAGSTILSNFVECDDDDSGEKTSAPPKIKVTASLEIGPK